MSAIATDYVRVRSACLLLQSSIERFRRENQAPLLKRAGQFKRAGQLFSILTNGSFESLQLDFDEDDKPHLGQTSVAKYMARRSGPPSQGWKTFLRNHAAGIVAMDLSKAST